MLKSIASSHAAKAVALCVCPVVTAGVVATKEPHVRRMIHKATAPKDAPKRSRAALSRGAIPPCPTPEIFASLPRVSAALPAAVGIPPDAQTATGAPAVESTPVNFTPSGPGYFGPGSFASGGGGGGFSPGVGTNPIGPGGPGGTAPISPVSGVPEPETWLQVLAGFALAGGTIRYFRIRRRASLTT